MNILFCKSLKWLFFVSVFFSVFSFSKAQNSSETQKEYINKTVDFFNNQNYDSALYYSEKVLENSPNNADIWLTKGKCLFFLNQEEKSILALNRAITINPKNVENYKYRATIYHLIGEHKKAIADYDFCLKNDPTDRRSLAGKAESHHRLKQYKKSINAYKLLLKFDLVPYARVLYLSARTSVYIDLKKYDKAEKDIDEALKINVEPSLILEMKSRLLVEKKQYEEALEVSQEVLKLEKQQENKELREMFMAFAYGNIGYIKHKLGKSEEGIKDIMYSLELMPTNSYAYKHLALISFDLGKKEEGCQHVEKALELGFTKMFGTEMEELKKEKCVN